MNFNVTPLFAIPLYQSNIKSNNIITFIETLDFERMPSKNGDYTVDKNILDNSHLTDLKTSIQEHIDYFMYEVLDCKTTQKFEIQNSWINKHHQHDFAGSHNHTNSLISGVYYISVEDQSGAIQFEKNKSYFNLWPDMIDIEFNNDPDRTNIFNAQAWAITPKNGDIVLFPSHLHHSVYENDSDRLRYSLAFNIFPRGELGGKLNTLRL
jgi:uncharacterized protein (TIGR02466 family)